MIDGRERRPYHSAVKGKLFSTNPAKDLHNPAHPVRYTNGPSAYTEVAPAGVHLGTQLEAASGMRSSWSGRA